METVGGENTVTQLIISCDVQMSVKTANGFGVQTAEY